MPLYLLARASRSLAWASRRVAALVDRSRTVSLTSSSSLPAAGPGWSLPLERQAPGDCSSCVGSLQ